MLTSQVRKEYFASVEMCSQLLRTVRSEERADTTVRGPLESASGLNSHPILFIYLLLLFFFNVFKATDF